ncbi:hypothetical protein [Persicobacter diffluens]|uniref:Uncharacterized protein n=1 Tax=Persicobacter diffluens TaxID=981 RepID=A0AAN5AIY2_9BACT|nr:hypothetical protein PEDI_15670 [Persicobacter diffluens]
MKRSVLKYFGAFVIGYLWALPAFAQFNLSDVYATRPAIKYSPVRRVLNMFSFDAGVGTGQSFYNQDLSGFDLYYRGDDLLIGIPQENGSMDTVAYRNWLTRPEAVSITGGGGNGGDFPDIPNPIPPGGGVDDGILDSANTVSHYSNQDFPELGYRGRARVIPIHMSIFFNYKKFRVGFGFEAEHHKFDYLNPYNSYNGLIGSYVDDFSTWNFKYNLLVGYEFFQFMGWSYVAELGIGKYSLGSAYDKNVQKPTVDIQLALPMYFHVSEYFRVFIRPSYEIRGYSTTIPGATSAIKTNQNSLRVTFGLSFTIPEIRRCPIRNCETQQKHQHGDREFRGQPIFYPQNPQIGQIPQTYQKLRWKRKNLKKGKGGKAAPKPAGNSAGGDNSKGTSE